MNVEAAIIQAFPDELFKTYWINWCESFLSQGINVDNSELSSFNIKNIPGMAQNADPPSRAVELYRTGVLLYPINVNGSKTLAWKKLNEDESIISNFGFISYLISKAYFLEDNNSNEKLEKAFCALCTICLIKQHFNFDLEGRNLSISANTFFQSLLSGFNQFKENKLARQYLASGMICSLKYDSYNESFIKKILRKEIITEFIITNNSKKGGNVRETINHSNIDNYLEKLENREINFNDTTNQRFCNFFVGNFFDNSDRGFVNKSMKYFKDFLEEYSKIEIDQINNPQFNSFYAKSDYDSLLSPTEDTFQLLKKIFNKYSEKPKLIQELMKSLEQGSLEAIKILGWSKVATVDPSVKNVIFYGSPGTGKSFTVESNTSGHSKTRITFHPETDYQSFVGSYKPVMDGVTIKYEFVPQAFTKAYCQAWLNPDNPHYLIIEEINRGNCAQIFGDLFQCLDRDETGKSKYEIDCDKDLADYLKKVFEGKGIVDDKIILPANLFIYATMNTSDQSLFPMDSAFKRRWDWEFVPIDYDDAKQLTIEVDAATKYNWSNFIKNINPKIKELTGSEDKQLGNRFVNPTNKKITLDQFKSKVLFYLWSEIYKDEFGTQNSIFKYEDNGEIKDFQFGELYDDNSTELVKSFLKFNGIEKEL
jgi:hypothetical protein